jgi:hypothetical protein
MLKKLDFIVPPIASCVLCSVLLAIPVTEVSASQPPSDAYTTTVTYVETFYPLWFTFHQAVGTNNRMDGPERVSPLYHSVVAVNDDTVYCSSYLDLTDEPVILTIPSTVSPDSCADETSATYSILTLDSYCDVFASGIPDGAPPIAGGTYALTGPKWSGTLPPGVVQKPMPVNFPSLLFRIDKYHAFSPGDYENQIHQAELFRLSLRLQTLSDYMDCPDHGGRTEVFPEIAFSIPYKTAADAEIANDPIAFLHELQTAVASPRTPTLSSYEQSLSDHFNALFGNRDVKKHSHFAAGAQAAHSAILDNYLTHLGPTNWIHFTNIGTWNDQNINEAIDRSSITEFIQYGNDIGAAAYYHTFSDRGGHALNGNHSHGYVMTFAPGTGNPNGGQPDASRFWSLTAYTPEAVELVPNPINKYEVASYTGAQLNPDGSLSVYMATELPPGVPMENWLPIPSGPFNIMLRVYGVVPGSPVADNTYVPPAIDRGINFGLDKMNYKLVSELEMQIRSKQQISECANLVAVASA